MLKILQARVQHYVNHELSDVQAGFRNGRGTRDQIANILWILEKAREFQKNIYFCFIDIWLCRSQQIMENSERDGNTRPPDLLPEKSGQVKKLHLEPDMEQWTGSKLRKEYVKAVYCTLLV